MFWHQFLYGACVIAFGFPLMALAAFLALGFGRASSGGTAIRIVLMLIAFALIAFGTVALMNRLFSINFGDVVTFSTVPGLTSPTLPVILGVFVGGPLALVVLAVAVRVLFPVLAPIARVIVGVAGLVAMAALVAYAGMRAPWRHK